MSKAASSQLQFAQIGCGLIGRKRAAALSSQGQLRYACDLDAARAASLAETAPGCRAITDHTIALQDPAVDAVIVSTMNASLAPIALAAVRAGKHVLVEKPGALSAAQLREIQTAAALTTTVTRTVNVDLSAPTVTFWPGFARTPRPRSSYRPPVYVCDSSMSAW